SSLQPRPEQPCITVRSSLRGSFVEVAVDDNGPGVPPEYVDRLFKEPLPSKAQGGRGLLLVQFLVEHHGGEIRLARKNEPGATFVFTMKVWE
ncbi:MAG: ATP-binding protein, partial [Chloroflexi bacterium]